MFVANLVKVSRHGTNKHLCTRANLRCRVTFRTDDYAPVSLAAGLVPALNCRTNHSPVASSWLTVMIRSLIFSKTGAGMIFLETSSCFF